MKTTNTFDQTATESQVNDFAAAFCPFGFLDMKCAVNYALNAGEDADWAAEQITEFAESCDMQISDCDPVYCVMNSILQGARNEIDTLTSFDIQNDASFDIYGSFMASSWDIDEDNLSELISRLADADAVIEDMKTGTQFYLSEIGISQEDIQNELSGRESA